MTSAKGSATDHTIHPDAAHSPQPTAHLTPAPSSPPRYHIIPSHPIEHSFHRLLLLTLSKHASPKNIINSHPSPAPPSLICHCALSQPTGSRVKILHILSTLTCEDTP